MKLGKREIEGDEEDEKEKERWWRRGKEDENVMSWSTDEGWMKEKQRISGKRKRRSVKEINTFDWLLFVIFAVREWRRAAGITWRYLTLLINTRLFRSEAADWLVRGSILTSPTFISNQSQFSAEWFLMTSSIIGWLADNRRDVTGVNHTAGTSWCCSSGGSHQGAPQQFSDDP